MIDKGKAGEDFVSKVAYNTFLKYWCYPGPLDITGDNKEICDLLIVFGDVCIIVEVKNIVFKDNYERYFNNSIPKALKQIKGAEKKLFGLRDNILLKHPDRDAVPFNKNTINNIIRVVVNLNTDTKYYQTSFFEDGKHITVMDADGWYSSISELDTLPDFVSYIKARCNLFNKYPAFMLPREEYDFRPIDGQSLQKEFDKLIEKGIDKFSFLSGSELDLVATYIKNGFRFPAKLSHSGINGLSMKIDGEWDKYLNSKIKSEKDEFEKDSFFIDKMVKEMLLDKDNGDRVAKLFYSLNRLERAVFSKHFEEFHEEVRNDSRPIEYNRTHYVNFNINLVLMYFKDDIPDKEMEGIMTLSLIHHAYLHNFQVKEIGLLGISESYDNYAFGFVENLRVKPEELESYIDVFKKMGWKTIDD